MSLCGSRWAFLVAAVVGLGSGAGRVDAAGQCDFSGTPDNAASVTLRPWASGLARPVEMKAAPGQGLERLYVVEQAGRIRVVDAGVVRQAPFIDITDRVTQIGGGGDERGLLGLAFHPQFASNGKFYVNYTTRGALRSRISEFRVGASGNGDPASERILMELVQPYSNHNGGGLVFGPDGYLYIGFGDGGSAGDPEGAGQDLTTLLAKILRIDVNSGSPYSIPATNPRFNVPGARPEIWAYGIRNPWRMSFDSVRGHLWVGDVGQNAWEEINVIQRGGNYGWKVMEGSECFRTTTCNSQGMIPPVFEYPRSEGISVTGGYVYRGSDIPALAGAYVFADYGSGKIWGLRYDPEDPETPGTVKTLLNSGRSIVSFGQDLRGELYVSDLTGSIFKIVAETTAGDGEFPTLLSETGCFSSLAPLRPAAGVVPYDVNHPLWSDGTRKGRFIKLPSGASINFSTETAGASHLGTLDFPEDTVLIKNFMIPVRTATGTRNKLIETRFLVKRDGAFEGFTYRWNEAETDATLLADAATRRVTMQEPGRDIPLEYYYPSPSDCVRCHTNGAGQVLGFQPRQLNKNAPASPTENQIRWLTRSGVFAPATVPADLQSVGRLPAVDDAAADLNSRARAYLEVNCAGCHNPGTTAGQLPMDFRASTPLSQIGVCNAAPRHGDLGVAGARGLLPGSPERSLVWLRLTSMDPRHRMPPLATSRVDDAGAALIRQWILGLRGCE